MAGNMNSGGGPRNVPNSWDVKALEIARSLEGASPINYSQRVAIYQCAILDAMEWATAPPLRAQADAPADERKAFEARFKGCARHWSAEDNEYTLAECQSGWEAWEARAASAPAPTEPRPAFNPAAECSPTLTQCPRCNNPHHACDRAASAPAAPKEQP